MPPMNTFVGLFMFHSLRPTFCLCRAGADFQISASLQSRRHETIVSHERVPMEDGHLKRSDKKGTYEVLLLA
jgi:hypothetical protein